MSYIRKPVRGRGRHKLPRSRIFAKRTITKEYEVYTFDELSDAAKENVREIYLVGQEAWLFEDICNDELAYEFPNSKLKVEFSLTYSQGDGLNIYGELRCNDALNFIKDRLDDVVISDIKMISDNITLDLKSNPNRYSYCVIDRNDFFEDILYDLSWDLEHDYKLSHNNANGDLNWDDYSESAALRDTYSPTFKKSLKIFTQELTDALVNLCGSMEDTGYKFFYEISDDELAEWCSDNGYEFDEDGNIMY